MRGFARLSNGFCAPTLTEEYYTSVNISPNSVSGQIQANSRTAQALGFAKLKPECSTNYSAGLIIHPAPRVQLTVDAYQIDLRDRIVGLGTILGINGTTVVSQNVLNALVGLGVTGQGGVVYKGINVFANGANTRTRGVEATATFTTDLASAGRVDWTLGFKYNTTTVRRLDGLPTSVYNTSGNPAFDQTQLLNANAVSALTQSTPKVKSVLNALYSNGPVSLNLRETIYGNASQWVTQNGLGSGPGAPLERTGTAAITDIDLGYKLTHGFRIDLGANNLFDKKAPTRPNCNGAPADGSNVLNGPIGFTPGASTAAIIMPRPH